MHRNRFSDQTAQDFKGAILRFIKELKPILLQLKEKGIYISQNLVELCLKQAGES